MEIKKKRLVKNASSAVLQVIFTAILYFFLYRYLLDHLGPKMLGVWSLVLSFSSVANLANFGLTSGLVKFVAEYLSENQFEKIGKLIFTSVVSLSLLFLSLSFIIWLGGRPLLHFFVEEDYLLSALLILPWSLASLSINSVAGVFTSVLEGYQKNYLRNFIYMFSGALMFVSCLFLTPKMGLTGVALSQLLQSLFVLIASIFLVQKISPYNRPRFWSWSRATFKEMFDYGYKFQVVSICQLLYEPTTKMLLSRFGGLALLGYYEMASRLVNQFRAVLVNSNQVVIPVVAETAKTKGKEDLKSFYAGMKRLILILAIPSTVLLLICTPFISTLWIGFRNLDFEMSMYILLLTTVFNILCGPAYFSCLGEGRLSLLVLAHSLIAILNLLLGFLLGKWIGGYGIILGWGLALATGSLLLTGKYNKMIDVTWKQIYSKNEIILMIFGIGLTIISLFTFGIVGTTINIYWITLGLTVIFAFFLVPFFLKNEMVRRYLSTLSFKRPNNT